MALRKLTGLDVLGIVFNHSNPPPEPLPYHVNALHYALATDVLSKGTSGAVKHTKSLGHGPAAAERIVSDAEKCVKFADELNKKGYRWNDLYGRVVTPEGAYVH
jgi:hypothetical protein